MTSTVTKITPERDWWRINWRELYQQRRLLATLVKRDLQVRYKNTVLGVLWVVVQPALATLIFTLIFTNVFQAEVTDVNYPVYTLVGFVFWQFFAGSVSTSATSVYEQIKMLQKIYFPRLFVPLTVVLRQLVDVSVSSLLLAIVVTANHVPWSSAGVIGYILGVLLMTVLTAGVSMIAASTNALYRDVRHLTPFVVQIWFYATPVFYDAGLLSGRLRFLAWCNPVTRILGLVRMAIFEQTLPLSEWLAATLVVVMMGWLGVVIFKNLETGVIDRT